MVSPELKVFPRFSPSERSSRVEFLSGSSSMCKKFLKLKLLNSEARIAHFRIFCSPNESVGGCTAAMARILGFVTWSWEYIWFCLLRIQGFCKGFVTERSWVSPEWELLLEMEDLEQSGVGEGEGGGGLLLKNCNVISMNGEVEITSSVHVLVKNKRIAYVGPSPPATPAAQVTHTIAQTLFGCCNCGSCRNVENAFPVCRFFSEIASYRVGNIVNSPISGWPISHGACRVLSGWTLLSAES